MVADPYLALGLTHDATQEQIKRAYRRRAMLYHPDRLQRTNAPREEIQRASADFAMCSQAYSLLSDEKRKQRYDHIYRLGGYDATPTQNTGRSYQQENTNPNSRQTTPEKGIGYTVTDPFAYILSRGKVKTKAVAGVTIPSRFNLAHATGGGLRLSFSSGKFQESPCGTIEVTSRTTQFAHGKRFNKVETTTLHNDGRKEVVIAGDDYVERRFSRTPKRKRQSLSQEKDGLTHTSTSDDLPWYMSAWNGFRENALGMCTNPCVGQIRAR